MNWHFTLTKNVHMYCHRLECKRGNSQFICPSEDSAEEDDLVLFWLDEIPLSESEVISFSKELENWAKQQDFKFKIYLGKKCLSEFLS